MKTISEIFQHIFQLFDEMSLHLTDYEKCDLAIQLILLLGSNDTNRAGRCDLKINDDGLMPEVINAMKSITNTHK